MPEMKEPDLLTALKAIRERMKQLEDKYPTVLMRHHGNRLGKVIDGQELPNGKFLITYLESGVRYTLETDGSDVEIYAIKSQVQDWSIKFTPPTVS